MSVTPAKTYNCRACENQLEFIKYILGEESGSRTPLYGCKNCGSFFSRIDFSCQTQNDIRSGCINDYIDNEQYLTKRVAHILNIVLDKYWLQSNGNKLLDIGCGVGWSLVLANKMGYDAYGVEPMIEAAKYAKEILKLKVVNSLFEYKIFGENEFDIIIMDQVLEHVPDPAGMLFDVFRALKPGGILFLAVPPNDWSRLISSVSFQLPCSILKWIGQNKFISRFSNYAKKYDTFCYPEGHINYFTSKAISVLATKCNAQLLSHFHIHEYRLVLCRYLRLSTGSFFLRKNL